MRAIILAAGRGSRLIGNENGPPKCLAQVGEMSLIERQIQALQMEGIDRIITVIGFGAEQVREVCGPTIEYIENTRHDKTNSLFSLWLAREKMTEGFIVLNADVLFHPQILKDLLADPHEDALLLAHHDREMPPMGDEEMKVRLRHGRVIDIGKELNPRKVDGENVGIVKFGRDGAQLLVQKMDALIHRGIHRAWAPRAFRDFALERPLYAVPTKNHPWIEIDFPEDYFRAVNEILPLIVCDQGVRPRPKQRLAARSVAAAQLGGSIAHELTRHDQLRSQD